MSKEEYNEKLQDALKRMDYYQVAILTHQYNAGGIQND